MQRRRPDRARTWAFGVALAVACASGAAVADDGARVLGPLEQEAVDDALTALGLAVDPAPEGKVVGRIHVVSQPVFSRRDWRLQWFNVFHRSTRAAVLEREVLLRPGQRYDQLLLDESVRNIQSSPAFPIAGRLVFQPDLSSVVALVPVASARPGQVDLLLVTRDLWSLRFNTTFEFQENAVTLLETSVSENNLLGWRKTLSLGFGFDQGAYHYGPTYIDPNIRGTRLALWTSALFYSSRETGRHEGDVEIVSLHRPLYALASRWGGGVDVVHQSVVRRVFLGNGLRPVDLAATPEEEQLPYQYRRRSVTVDASAVRSFGAGFIQRVTLGYLVDRRRADVLSDFPGDAATARLFLAQWAPVSEQRSEPYLAYDAFTPRFAVLRNLGGFDLREVRPVGVVLRARVAEGLPALGADLAATSFGAAAGFAHAGGGGGGGYVSFTVGGSARLRHGDGRLIDQAAGVAFYAATPLVDGLFRVVASAELDGKRADTSNTPFVVGGALAALGYRIAELNDPAALRGYQVGEFIGDTAFAGHLELRTAALSVASQRIGGLAFYDVGDAAASLGDLLPYNDVGVGVRWLIPQLNASVVRVDWAVPLQDAAITRVGLPGRVSAGFQQVF